MRITRLAAATTAAVALTTTVVAPPSLAASSVGTNNKTSYTSLSTYCADVQLEVARIKAGSVTINTVAYDANTVEGTRTGYSAFRSSKTTVDAATRTITVRQWIVNDAAGEPVQVMCKTKSQDALVAVLGADTFYDVAGHCDDAVATILRRAFTTLPSRDRALASATLERTVVDATEYDDFGGELWTVRGYQTILKAGDGSLRLRSQGLFTPADPNTSLSNAFVDYLNLNFGTDLPYGTTNGDMVALGFTSPLTLGVHYCTVPATAAVQQALVG